MTYVQLDGTDDFIEMDSPQLSVTDLDVTVDVALDDWTPSSEEALFTDRNSGDGFTLAVHTSGGFRVYTNGTANTTTDPGLTDGTRHTIRALYDGAAGTVEIYVDGSLHDTETASIPASLDANPFTSLYVGSGIIGASDNAAGKFYGFTAIYDGTTEIDVDFENFADGATSGTASTGGTVTIDGSSVTEVGGVKADITHRVKIGLGGALTDISNLVNGFTCTTGRDRDFAAFQAGRCTFTIDDRTGDYIPGGGGTYSAEQWIGREVIITAEVGSNSQVLWRGHIDDLDVEVEGFFFAGVTVHAVGPLALLGRAELPSGQTFDADTSGTRVIDVLDVDEVDRFGYWSSSAAVTDISAGGVQLQAETDAGGNVLQYLQTVEKSDGGRLFVRNGDNPGGVLTFRPRSSSAGSGGLTFTDESAGSASLVDGGDAETATVVDTYDGGTAADSPTAALDGGDASTRYVIPHERTDFSYVGVGDLVNRVAYTRVEGGTEQVVEDVASQERFGVSSVSESDLLNASDADVLELAEARIARQSYPLRNVAAMRVWVDPLDVAQAAMVMRTTVGDHVRVVTSPPGYLTTGVLTSNVRVESVTHNVTDRTHTVDFRLTALSDEFAGLTDGGNAATVSFADTWDGGTAEDVQRDRVLDGGDATFV